ncbi:hypothetical protein [Pseudopedobacter beijingensis]|uniref:Por secretion system C-terminal sorting domain-containing protein n=1 Tax=Pseudopedobacter beijingensis TaxID=1207056 RepID=A0ABW4ICM6_9SPHI
MKKNLLLTMCMIAGISAYAQFTPGNLAVYRYGDGEFPMSNGQRVPVFIDEYTASGSYVKTIPISRTANGANYGLEGLALTSGGAYESEGYPVLSKDGSTLSIIGHNPDQAGQFVVATINAAGAVGANTLVVDAIGAPRSAVVEGTSVYFNGYDGGVRYKTVGTTDASVRVSSAQNAPRVLTIAETVLNGVTLAKIFAPDNQNNIPFADLITTSTSFKTNDFGGTTAPSNAHQVAVVKSPGSPARTLLYVIDDNGPVIRKYRSNLGGTSWLAKGDISVPAGTRSLTAVKTSTGVKIFFTTWGTPGSNDSRLYTVDDIFTDASDGDTNFAGMPELIATASANTTFRGVTLAPGTGVLPVTLTSFEAKNEGNIIKLNWLTAAEKNSSHFDILKSFNGIDFQKIGEVKATGNADSNTNYTFNDNNPFPGVNYYKLQQFDKDGKSEFYGPVQVTTTIEKTDFNIYASALKAIAEVSVYSATKQQGKIRILDINGQVLLEESLNLEKGYNKISLPVNRAKAGVQIAILNAQAEVITKKFVWQ